MLVRGEDKVNLTCWMRVFYRWGCRNLSRNYKCCVSGKCWEIWWFGLWPYQIKPQGQHPSGTQPLLNLRRLLDVWQSVLQEIDVNPPKHLINARCGPHCSPVKQNACHPTTQNYTKLQDHRIMLLDVPSDKSALNFDQFLCDFLTGQ